ncbi:MULTISPECIES: hypothetical protein [unclassified Streptomyces]|uniref:hypothetical protein n=1 Tax=unclassified Streptomyces TaxID=2593676 RepID=UPI00225AD020|nr:MULTISPECIES: hypothetical protein [unclassified Streptomyces]MCX4883201.1 hypothetical protein [Streptomyces sp. NBC_00847]MCX5423225.1 hypothetical protein [Streptomyces sp. NBC_00078]
MNSIRRIVTTIGVSALLALGSISMATPSQAQPAPGARLPAHAGGGPEWSLHAIVGGLDLDLATLIPGFDG